MPRYSYQLCVGILIWVLSHLQTRTLIIQNGNMIKLSYSEDQCSRWWMDKVKELEACMEPKQFASVHVIRDRFHQTDMHTAYKCITVLVLHN